MRAVRSLLLVFAALSPAACSSLAQGVLDASPSDAPTEASIDGGNVRDVPTEPIDLGTGTDVMAADVMAVDVVDAGVMAADVVDAGVTMDVAADVIDSATADVVDVPMMDVADVPRVDVVDVPGADVVDVPLADAVDASVVDVVDVPRVDVVGCGAGVVSCAGACCALPHVATNVCSTGTTCAIGACATGFTDCNSRPDDGCEVALASDPVHCGTCGRLCTYPNARAACSSGACSMGSCNSGFGDCDLSPTNGCETPLNADAFNCGACANICSARANGSPVCITGQCRLACNASFGDCNGVLSDGCETSLLADALNCGACGNVCGGGLGCAAGACVEIPTPRAIAPLSTATVTSQTPTLRWVNGPGATGAVVYVANNPFFTGEVATTVLSGNSLRHAALAAGTWYWRTRGLSRTIGNLGTAVSPTWQFIVGRRSATVDRSFGTVSDFNRDGYGDFVAAAPNSAATGATTPPSFGRVRMFLGGPSGIVVQPAELLAGTRASENISTTEYGAAIANAGDTNGDGFPDLLVAAVNASGRHVYVYLSNAASVGSVPMARLDGNAGAVDFGRSVSSAGDVNGDGFADVIVGASDEAYLFLGSASGLGSAGMVVLTGSSNEDYGRSVSDAGDVNGDGYGDVLVGAPGFGSNNGRFYLYLGSAAGIIRAATNTVSGPFAVGRFGWSVASAGDVNADGYADIIIGAPDATNRGASRVYLGSASGLQGVGMIDHSIGMNLGQFGSVVAGVGDVDGDGFGDVLVGAPGVGAGSAYLLHGGGAPGLAAAPLLLDPGATAPGVGARFGAAVSGTGDANQDGFMDFVVGAPCATTTPNCGSGLVYYFRGATAPPATAFGVFGSTDAAGSNFGGALAWQARPRGRLAK